jgi:hypothetical protein
MKFPREFSNAAQGGIEVTSYGPMEIDSPIREDTKFMDVWRLKRLYHEPAEGAKVKRVISDLMLRDKQGYIADHLAGDLNEFGEEVFHLADGETYSLRRDKDAPPALSRALGVIIPAAPPVGQLTSWIAAQTSADLLSASAGLPVLMPLPMPPASESHPISFREVATNRPTSVTTAGAAHIQILPTSDPDVMHLNIDLDDVVRYVGSEPIRKRSEPQGLDVPRSPGARSIASRDVRYYARLDHDIGDRQRIGRELLVLANQILAESNSRVSFAISCLVLVMVGCALGMMFRSGNFLSAFALSFIPALMTITLIVAGQRVSGNLPDELKVDIMQYINTPLKLGLGLIWTGNAVNFVLAVILLGRLQRK